MAARLTPNHEDPGKNPFLGSWKIPFLRSGDGFVKLASNAAVRRLVESCDAAVELWCGKLWPM